MPRVRESGVIRVIEWVLENLGLGEAAKRGVGTGSNQIPDMSFFASSLSSNGWQKLPSGLIIQYVGFISDPTGQGTVNLPIAFPTTCIGACTLHARSPAGGAEYLQVWGETNTSVYYHSWSINNGTTSLLGGNTYKVLAIGY